MIGNAEVLVSKKLLLALAIGMGALGAGKAICRPCAAEARLLTGQILAADQPADLSR